MRKTKRFTAQVISRFAREGRGSGSNESYIPWHRVSRGDPSSRGRSHLVNWRGRLRELLSDGELAIQHFATMLPNVLDCREQFPLDLNMEVPSSPYERPVPFRSQSHRGTVQIAADLGLKHPQLRSKGTSDPWVMTTDFLMDFASEKGEPTQLAIAFKPLGWKQEKRTVELLRIEREYWLERGVEWLLITPEQYNRPVSIFLRRVACWALDDRVDPPVLNVATSLALQAPALSVTQLLWEITTHTGSLELSQRALWQSVWFGLLPVKLAMGWRPHLPLRHLSQPDFWQQNPIHARRSAWI